MAVGADRDIDVWLSEMAARPVPVPAALLARVEADAIRLLPSPSLGTHSVGRRWAVWRRVTWWPGVGALAACLGAAAVVIPWSGQDSGAAVRAWEALEMWEWEASVHDAVFEAVPGA